MTGSDAGAPGDLDDAPVTGRLVRPFTPADQEAVGALIVAGMAERWGEEFDPLANPDVADVQGNYVDRGAEVVVVEAGGAVVATGLLAPESAHRGRVLRMSVAVAHRRAGHARAVVAELVARARRRGLTELVVTTDTPWSDAVALYVRCGFTVTSADDHATHLVMTLR